MEKDDRTKTYVKQKVMITPEHVDRVTEQIKQVYQKIMNQEFSEGCNDERCYWCNFAKENRRIHIHPEESSEAVPSVPEVKKAENGNLSLFG